jgi:hypothetical protein
MDGSSILKVEAVKADIIRNRGTRRWGSRDETLALMIENYAGWLQEAKSMAQSGDGTPGNHEEFPYESFWRTLTGGGDGLLTTLELSSSPPAELNY